jgi:hypothetical protein
MKMPAEIAANIVDGLSFSSNRFVDGRMIGEQHFALRDITAALETERLESQRLKTALFDIQCDMLERGTNEKITALGHRRRAMRTRQLIIDVLAK